MLSPGAQRLPRFEANVIQRSARSVITTHAYRIAPLHVFSLCQVRNDRHLSFFVILGNYWSGMESTWCVRNVQLCRMCMCPHEVCTTCTSARPVLTHMKCAGYRPVSWGLAKLCSSLLCRTEVLHYMPVFTVCWICAHARDLCGAPCDLHRSIWGP